MMPARSADLIVRNARLGDGRLVDLAITDGILVNIGPDLPAAGQTEIDAAGGLTTPPLVDAHVHLDGALTAGQPRANASGTLQEGIQIWQERKQSLTREDVKHRALDAILWEVVHGTLWIRCHVDICDPHLTALRAMLELREEVLDLVEIQLVAFPQDGIFATPDGPALLERALEIGADVVGGIPHHEFTRALGERELEIVFDLARRYHRPIDCHTDETDDPGSRFTEVMAANTIRDGLAGRVTASHCTAMHSYDNAYAAKVIALLAHAGVNVVASPFDNSVLQGRFDTYPKRRGLTRVKELLAAGVNVCLGHDSIMDPFYPLGRGDMLQAADLALHLLQMSAPDEIDTMLSLITERGARTLGITDQYGLEEGKPASLIIFDAESRHEAIRLAAARRWVIKDGRVVATTTPARGVVHRQGATRPVRPAPTARERADSVALGSPS